jgi:hypothetical protein
VSCLAHPRRAPVDISRGADKTGVQDAFSSTSAGVDFSGLRLAVARGIYILPALLSSLLWSRPHHLSILLVFPSLRHASGAPSPDTVVASHPTLSEPCTSHVSFVFIPLPAALPWCVTLPPGFPTLKIPLDHDTGLVRNVTE